MSTVSTRNVVSVMTFRPKSVVKATYASLGKLDVSNFELTHAAETPKTVLGRHTSLPDTETQKTQKGGGCW